MSFLLPSPNIDKWLKRPLPGPSTSTPKLPKTAKENSQQHSDNSECRPTTLGNDDCLYHRVPTEKHKIQV